MKKILAGTSALIAAGLVAGAAHAADPISLKVGGYAHWSFGAASQHSTFRSVETRSEGWDVKGDHRLWFTGNTTLDNGLTVGVYSSFHPGARGAISAHKAYVTVGGAFGTVILGKQDHAAELIHKGAPHAGSGSTFGFAQSNTTAGNWIAAPATAGYRGHTIANTGSGNDAITYLSPSFSGFQVGASFIPHAGASHDRTRKTNSARGYGIGAVYAGNFNDVSVHFDAAHVWVDVPAGTDLRDWQLGAQVGFAGFTVGAGYSNLYDAASSAAGVGNLTNWEAGVAYTTGPYAVSLSYRQQERAISGVKNPRVNHWQAGATYAMGPGVSLQAQVAHMTFDSTQGAVRSTANYNTGWTAFTGVALSF